MARSTKPSYSDRALNVAETFQYHLGNTRVGSLAVKAVTGSCSPLYEQLLWLPRLQVNKQDVQGMVLVHGDAYAHNPARRWTRAAKIAVDAQKWQALTEPDDSCEALAYISDKVLHVGVQASRAAIMAPMDEQYLGVFVRQGRGDVQYTAGAYNFERKEFLGIEQSAITLDDEHLPINILHRRHPDMRLV